MSVTPQNLNREQRRQLNRQSNRAIPGIAPSQGVPLLVGGQRWKCANALCGYEPPNIAAGIPQAITVEYQNKKVFVCPSCFERMRTTLFGLIPPLMEWDHESEQSLEVQLREKRQARIKAADDAFKLAQEATKVDAPPTDVEVKERVDAAGLVLAR